MPDLCCQYNYAAVVINGDPSTDTLITDYDEGEIVGLDGRPIRRQVDPIAQDDGGETQPARWGPRIIRFKGRVHIGTVDDPAGNMSAYRAALNALQRATILALEAQRDANATLSWTPQGLTAHSIAAKYGIPDGEIQFGGPTVRTTFTFSLLAEDPDIAVA